MWFGLWSITIYWLRNCDLQMFQVYYSSYVPWKVNPHGLTLCIEWCTTPVKKNRLWFCSVLGPFGTGSSTPSYGDCPIDAFWHSEDDFMMVPKTNCTFVVFFRRSWGPKPWRLRYLPLRWSLAKPCHFEHVNHCRTSRRIWPTLNFMLSRLVTDGFSGTSRPNWRWAGYSLRRCM